MQWLQCHQNMAYMFLKEEENEYITLYYEVKPITKNRFSKLKLIYLSHQQDINE